MTSEISTIGSVMLDAAVLPGIRAVVKAEDFANERCKAAFCAACALADSGETVDPVTIKAQAKKDGTDLENDWLRDVMELTPTAANAICYATNVAEEAQQRRVKELAAQIMDSTVESSAELIATMQTGIEEIKSASFRQGVVAPDDRIHSLFDKIIHTGATQFVPSGYPSLDQILGGGFVKGGLYIIGARPAVGKTTFAINVAEQIPGKVLVVSLEMSAEAITAKQFARNIAVPASKIMSASDDDTVLWDKLAVATNAVIESGIYLNSRFDLTTGQIRMLAQGIPDLKAIVIDYLGLILPATQSSSAYERVSAISRELKRLALQMNLPVICLAQLSRGVESREDKRPRLSDLRDSGAIEQDADAVLFLYREDYYDTQQTAAGAPSAVELSVAKNRHGRLGVVNYDAYLSISYFRERSNPYVQ